MNEEERGKLREEALRAREKAIAPYSNYSVGAALLTEGGEVIHGCNVENASYGLSMCAERVALYAALSRGIRRFAAIAVATSGPLSSPCGPCRQLLWEYCGDIPVIMVSADSDEVEQFSLKELFPRPFELEAE